METIYPAQWLEDLPNPKPHTVLLVLNRKWCNLTQLNKIWAFTEHHIILDGAAEIIHPLGLIPDLVTGDGDSITKEGLDWIHEKGIPYEQCSDQYSTDFMKALKAVKRDYPETEEIYAFGALGGRVDHHWHSILMLSKSLNESYRLFLLSSQNITLAVESEAKIITPRHLLGKACGVAPIEGPTQICMKGFMWDVEDYETSWVTRLSTSNYLAADEVYISGSAPLLFTIELGKFAEDR